MKLKPKRNTSVTRETTLVSFYANLYNSSVTEEDLPIIKVAKFRGSSLRDLRAFPGKARREAGQQIDQVQRGLEPDDWRPMPTVGQGAQEIRIRDEAGAFRVIYVAKFESAIYILHCFQKKSEQTSKSALDLARKRYADLVKELGNER
jgi:phage-related protein